MFIRSTAFLLFLGAYVYLRVIHPLRWPKWVKALVAAAALVPPTLRDVMLNHAGGSYFAPQVAPWALYGTAVLFVAFFIYLCGVLGGSFLRAVAQRALSVWKNKSNEAQQRVINCYHLLLLPVALSVSAIGVYCGLAEPSVRSLTLPFPIAAPLRIVQLSDLHISRARSAEYMSDIVDRVNALEPDLVVITGDFTDGLPDTCADAVAPLRGLRAKYGVYGVTGNHDYYSCYALWSVALETYGICMLNNAHIQLPHPHALTLAGVTDESASYERMEGPNLPKALEGAPGDLPTVLLAHRPIVAREAEPQGVDLQLSGHMHGGLVWGIGKLVAVMDAGYLSGLYRVGHMQLYVSPGTGSSTRTPLRIGTPAEITLITLVPERKAAAQP